MLEVIAKALAGMVVAGVVLLICALIIGTVVMWLWNYVMVGVFHQPELTWVQAYALTVLCGILFKSSVTTKE